MKLTAKLFFWAVLLPFVMFSIGRGYQFKVDEAKINQVFEWSTQCDLPLNDGLNTVIEVDCFTPEAYAELDRHFFNTVLSDSNLVKYNLHNKFNKTCQAEDFSIVPCDFWDK